MKSSGHLHKLLFQGHSYVLFVLFFSLAFSWLFLSTQQYFYQPVLSVCFLNYIKGPILIFFKSGHKMFILFVPSAPTMTRCVVSVVTTMGLPTMTSSNQMVLW